MHNFLCISWRSSHNTQSICTHPFPFPFPFPLPFPFPFPPFLPPFLPFFGITTYFREQKKTTISIWWGFLNNRLIGSINKKLGKETLDRSWALWVLIKESDCYLKFKHIVEFLKILPFDARVLNSFIYFLFK